MDRSIAARARARWIAGGCGLLALLPLAGCWSNVGPVTLSTTAAEFGQMAVGTERNRVAVVVHNPTDGNVGLRPSISGAIEATLTTAGTCRERLTPKASCSVVIRYAPTKAGRQTGMLTLGMSGKDLPAAGTVSLAGTGVALGTGEALVERTRNPLVAMYQFAAGPGAQVTVEFGPDTTYGLRTSAQPADRNGVASVLVAGMRAETTYHMRARAEMPDGRVVVDRDHSFRTTNFPAAALPKLSVKTVGTPQPGIELVDAVAGLNPAYMQAFATDLQGHVIWGYNYEDRGDTLAQPVKLLPNGDMVLVTAFNTQDLAGKDLEPAPEQVNLREIDLAGDPVRDMSLAELNARLRAAGYPLKVEDLHHDVLILPNGHWMLVVSEIEQRRMPWHVQSTGVVGDALIELDADWRPVWVWREFDHMDVNRHPLKFPDWTHTNAVLYSPEDGSLLVSMRHQHWIMKVDYGNGKGSGNVLWRLGVDGDFRLLNGKAPEDWFYAQHQPAFVGGRTSGTFELAVMDNGFGRRLPNGKTCDTQAWTAPGCYSMVPVLEVNELARTARIVMRDRLPDADYSVWGGGTTSLPNSDLEFVVSAEQMHNSEVTELKTDGASFQPVWQMRSEGTNFYRANRIASLYPGVQW